MEETERELLNYEQAALLLGLSKGALYSMVSRQQIPHYRLTGRTVRFDRDELIEWLENRAVKDKRKEVLLINPCSCDDRELREHGNNVICMNCGKYSNKQESNKKQ